MPRAAPNYLSYRSDILFMPKAKTYRVENVTIVCNETCPIYYCNEPCRVRNHVEKYSKIIRMGYECSML